MLRLWCFQVSITDQCKDGRHVKYLMHFKGYPKTQDQWVTKSDARAVMPAELDKYLAGARRGKKTGSKRGSGGGGGAQEASGDEAPASDEEVEPDHHNETEGSESEKEGEKVRPKEVAKKKRENVVSKKRVSATPKIKMAVKKTATVAASKARAAAAKARNAATAKSTAAAAKRAADKIKSKKEEKDYDGEVSSTSRNVKKEVDKQGASKTESVVTTCDVKRDEEESRVGTVEAGRKRKTPEESDGDLSGAHGRNSPAAKKARTLEYEEEQDVTKLDQGEEVAGSSGGRTSGATCEATCEMEGQQGFDQDGGEMKNSDRGEGREERDPLAVHAQA